ncbi:TraB/GumN family protein [Sediminibacterium soli]|uniref:TraB/GumN family protein n=1 Tax=Sediminibacterium soli TaxID=2698829 RepID=UPI00137A5069|nr:TraB/GumN family protein [Sediminibacterium soli]NCI46382.1 TraB/GumN family protein [Sediminibacterium soli]
MKKWCCALMMAMCWLVTDAQSGVSSLLWQVSGNGLQQPSYLFGTFHIVCKDDFQITDTLQQKLLSTRQLYGELDMDTPGQEMQLALKMMMKDKTLQQLFSPADYKQVSDSFQRITGMPLAMFNNFIPFVPMSLAVLNSVACAEKLQPETEFMKIAKQHQLEVLGLETIQDQVDAINTQPIDSMVLQLKNMLLNFDSSKQSMQEMITMYKKRNIDTIYGYMKSKGVGAEFETELLIKRNRRWVPLIEKAMTDKPSFFAVGAGHLGGPEGVVSLLRKQGYQVSPVSY